MTDLIQSVIVCILFGCGVAGLGVVISPLANVGYTFLARHWDHPRRVSRGWAAGGVSLLVGLAYFGVGMRASQLDLALAFSGLAFVTTYVSIRLFWFCSDAARDFLTLVGPYVNAIARLGLGFLMIYPMLIVGFGWLFQMLYEADRSAFSDAPLIPRTAIGEFCSSH